VKVYYPKYSKEEIIEIIKKRLSILRRKLPIVKVILFGSYAKDRYTVASDVDLLVIYDGRKIKNDYHIVWDTLMIDNLQPHIYTLDEYERLKSSGSYLPKEAGKGIVLYP
jgi:hypothetical protein